MIGRNETASKKAKFWQSFVRSLKGSDDIRATDSVRPRSLFRPLSDYPEFLSTWPYGKSIYDNPIAAADRITVPGYRYDPLHRDTYGYSPRPIFPHNYSSSLDRYRPVYHVTKLTPFDADKAWRDHLDRVAKREPSVFHTTYPFSRYPLYLVYSKRPAPPVPIDPHRDWLDHLDRMGLLDRLSNLWPRYSSPTPIKPGEWAPRPSEVAYNYAGQPIYSRGGLLPSKRLFRDLLNPSPYAPISSFIRDPWWWDWPFLRPYSILPRWTSPFYLRDSYLSPVKRTYLWDKHPIRPFAAVY
ncbi:putative myofilin [Trypoxylus dichotomus]